MGLNTVVSSGRRTCVLQGGNPRNSVSSFRQSSKASNLLWLPYLCKAGKSILKLSIFLQYRNENKKKLDSHSPNHISPQQKQELNHT